MRSIWKGIWIRGNSNNRGNMVLPSWVGKWMKISNGKETKVVEITGAMVGLRVGELSITKKRAKYKRS